jgi:hypothetical protein
MSFCVLRIAWVQAVFQLSRVGSLSWLMQLWAADGSDHDIFLFETHASDRSGPRDVVRWRRKRIRCAVQSPIAIADYVSRSITDLVWCQRRSYDIIHYATFSQDSEPSGSGRCTYLTLKPHQHSLIIVLRVSHRAPSKLHCRLTGHLEVVVFLSSLDWAPSLRGGFKGSAEAVLCTVPEAMPTAAHFSR